MEQDRFKTPDSVAAQEQARRQVLRQTFGGTAKPVARPQVAFQPRRAAPINPVIKSTQTTAPAKSLIASDSAWQRPPVTVAASKISTNSAPANISINISLPQLNLGGLKTIALKLRMASVAGINLAKPYCVVAAKKVYSVASKMPASRLAPALGALTVVSLLGFGGLQLVHRHQLANANALSAAATKKLATVATTKPGFKPVIPASKTELAAGKAGQTAFDTKRDTYSYNDTLKGQALVVSQQPLPANFKSNKDALANISKALNATQAVVTSAGATGYIATDTKSNSQTVVFALNDKLIFIRSPFSHPTTDWQVYLSTLKQQ